MIHKSCAQTPESPGTRAASSAGGAPFVPTFHCAARTVTRVGVPLSTRTVIGTCAGTTPGGLISTRTG